MGSKTKVLIVSYLPWRNDVSVGNTFSNIFGGMQDSVEFAHIYFKGGMPSNDICEKYFYIPEMELAKSIFSRKPVGRVVKRPDASSADDKPDTNSRAYDKARQLRWDSLILLQDMLGIMGVWRSDALDKFIQEFNPDLVFGPLGRMPVANEMMEYIHNKYNVPVITYAWDDHFTFKKSLSPFSKIRTRLERRYIQKSADASSFLYTITEEMRTEYAEYFKKECKILYKCYDFDNPQFKEHTGDPVKMVYMGNLGAGRWQELAKLAKILQRVNGDSCKAVMDIYSMSPRSNEMMDKLNIEGTSRLMEPVPSDRILETMSSADILIHVEPTNEKDRLFFRLSFSTKLADYLFSARCILAIGGHTAAMSYLKRNDAAVVVIDDEPELEKRIRNLLSEKDSILKYGEKAWNCGVRNHQRKTIQSSLMEDFLSVKNTGNPV